MPLIHSAGLAFVGTIGLVAWSFPWMVIAYVPIVALIVSRRRATRDMQVDVQYFFAAYAQPGNRDVKRSDSVQRSKIYANFGEQVRRHIHWTGFTICNESGADWTAQWIERD
jgi:hypothetical protein